MTEHLNFVVPERRKRYNAARDEVTAAGGASAFAKEDLKGIASDLGITTLDPKASKQDMVTAIDGHLGIVAASSDAPTS